MCWRHLLDFPKKKEGKGELDLGETATDDDDCKLSHPRSLQLSLAYVNLQQLDPSLDDITIEGAAFARSLISDIALDVLLYQSSYREQIIDIVLRESNRIYGLFKERNADFKGKVHIIGHSLGSAIMFDLLCRQKERPPTPEPQRNPLRFWPSQVHHQSKASKELRFEFEVDDFYCLGSPIGLFQMLKGRLATASFLVAVLLSRS